LELISKPVHELIDLLETRAISSEELVGQYLDRIEQVEPTIKAFITVDREGALEAARAVDESRRDGKAPSRLAGIPVAVKDNICTKGMATTCASEILKDFVSPYDAYVIERLRSAGMIIVGKTNMDEFAMGSSTENSAFFPTRNPWDLDRVPGGSSGGSAAAVASGEVPVALGSDTGGSVRTPASYCGVVGLKPTYGLVSRYGLVPYASSLDQVGILAGNVRDCAIMLGAIAGHDPRDSTSVKTERVDYEARLYNDIAGRVVGIPRECFGGPIDPHVTESVYAATKTLERLGARVQEVSIPTLQYALAVYYVIGPAEASASLARYDGVAFGYRYKQAEDSVSMFMETRGRGLGPEVKRRILIGTYVLSEGNYDRYFRKAMQVRTLIKKEFEQALEHCDVLVTPTTPTVAFRLGEKTDDPMSMYMSDMCTVVANLAGVPAVSVPCAKHEGCPIGLQLIGRSLDEALLLNIAYAYEQASGFEIEKASVV
jgi:aspartyl-tRNA(Asn)/glutamyl-tRNA(Gln) amidotransferase subunit A